MDHTRVGELLTSDQPRDAIHIAVASVVAAERLMPGQAIGFLDASDPSQGVVRCERAMSIGIVDPFLQSKVLRDQRFWMFLHPNTITSLRHNWTHPAFGENIRDTAGSERWLRDFLSIEGPSYENLIHAVNNGGEYGDGSYNYIRIDGDYIHCGGFDAHGDIPSEFWDHVENITGKKLRERPSHFSCSC